MGKILLTGMTAPQSSENANNRSLGFAGVLKLALTEAGHDVAWISPSVHMSKEFLDSYDSVIVGVSPLTSMGGNRSYGALSVISLMFGSDKLRLFLDSPNASQMDVSLRAIKNNPDNLVKEFYSYRKEYSTVVASKDILARCLDAVDILLERDWPVTLYPALPWSSVGDVKLAPNAKANLVGVNLDSFIIEDVTTPSDRRSKWVIDTSNTPWAKSTLATLSLPNSPMKWNKGWTDLQVLDQISRSIGALITSHKKDGTWWSYRYVQALNTGTPVATDWIFSSKLGSPWGTLAASIESMSQQSRDLLALAQRELYVANIKTKKEAIQHLETVLSVPGKENNED